MAKITKIRERASIALHVCILLTSSPNQIHSARDLANSMGVSFHHLLKILQKLTQSKILSSVRGASGGYFISRHQLQVSLLTIFHEIEPPHDNPCLLDRASCLAGGCVFGDWLKKVNTEFEAMLDQTTLSDFAPKQEEEH
jgi:Rrf2 family protein